MTQIGPVISEIWVATHSWMLKSAKITNKYVCQAAILDLSDILNRWASTLYITLITSNMRRIGHAISWDPSGHALQDAKISENLQPNMADLIYIEALATREIFIGFWPRI